MKRRKIEIEIESIDRISDLPTCILSDILFSLPLRDATRTCVLSKSWNALGSFSLPHRSFKLDQSRLMGRDFASYTDERQRKFINDVEESLDRLKIERFRIPVFRVRINVFHSVEISSFIDRWLQLAARHQVYRLMLIIYTGRYLGNLYKIPNIELASIGPLQILHLVGCKLQPSSLCDDYEDDNGNARPLALKEITLLNVVVDNQDDVFQKFIDRCSSLRKLTIKECYGVKTLRLCNHPKLKELHVKVILKEYAEVDLLERIEVDSLDLHTITCIGVHILRPLIVQATRCKNLLQLEIAYAILEENFVQNISTTFPFLRSLTLRRCSGLKNLSVVRHPLLKTLRLCYSHFHLKEQVVFDTPNLLLLSYDDFLLPPKLVFSNACHLKKSTFNFSIGGDFDTSWFLRLRDHLGRFNKHDMTLSLFIPLSAEFQLSKVATLDLPCHVQLLSLRLLEDSGRRYVGALIDGLFWSCHPKYLRFKIDTTDGIGGLQVIFENLIANAREEDPICCKSRPIKCWRHFLKQITIKRIDTANTTLSEVELMMQRLATHKSALFALQWL